MDEIIKYEVEIDTAKGKAQIKKMIQDGQQADGGEGGAGPGTQPDEGEEDGKPVKGSVLTGMARNLVRLMRYAGPMMESMGLTGRNIAANPVSGSAGAAFGAGAGIAKKFGATGKVVGEFIEAIGAATEHLYSMADGLRNYSGSLFATMTALDYSMEGMRYQLAQGVEQALSDFIDALVELADAVIPLLIDLLNWILPVLTMIIKGFTKMVIAIHAFVKAVEYAVWAIIDIFTPDILSKGPKEKAHKAWNEMTKLLKELVSETRSIGNLMRGHKGSTALFRSMVAWTKDSPKHGFMGGAGLRETPDAKAGFLDLMPNHPRGALGNWIRKRIVDARPGQEQGKDGRGFPRPQRPDVALKLADNLNIDAGDQDRLHMEMLQIKNMVLDLINGVHREKWMQLAHARTSIFQGVI